MNNEVIQEVFDKLQDVLPDKWEKVVLFVGYTAESYSMKFYTSDENGVYTDCFSQAELGEDDLILLFMQLDKILSRERNSLDDKNKWTVLTMIVESDGSVKTELEYNDISENFLAYEKQWKETYLK